MAGLSSTRRAATHAAGMTGSAGGSGLREDTIEPRDRLIRRFGEFAAGYPWDWLPGQTCTFDANFNLIGCTATTIDVTVAWTGQGPISRNVFNDHFKSDGFSETVHFNGTDRNATATGTFNGSTLTAGNLLEADLTTDSSGTVRVCIGTSC